jgi:predicted RNA-binding protein YlqC (UPF0109 family)
MGDDANRAFDATKLVEVVVRSLVDTPEEVSIKETRKGKTVYLKLKVSPNDMGKVIGRQGRIARAIRTVLKAYATKENMFVELDIE